MLNKQTLCMDGLLLISFVVSACQKDLRFRRCLDKCSDRMKDLVQPGSVQAKGLATDGEEATCEARISRWPAIRLS